MKNQIIFLKTIAVMLLFMQQSSITAQSIDWSGGAIQPEHIKHFQKGRTIPTSEYAISVVGLPLGGVVRFRTDPAAPSFTNIAGAGVFNIAGNLQASWDAASSRVILQSSVGLAETSLGYLELELSDPASPGMTRRKIFHFVNRKPIDLLFLLDRSGSMGCDYNEDSENNWPACTSTPPGSPNNYRWARLESAVHNFIRKWSPTDADSNIVLTDHIVPGFTEPGDKMSAMYFSGSTQSGLTFRDVSVFRTDVGASMDGAETPSLASDGTSIGNGLREAITSRLGGAANSNRRQAIMLFTDGEQNNGNWIKDEAPNEGRRIERSKTDATEEMNLDSATNSPFQLFTIGLVETPAPGSTLSRMASNTMWHSNITVAHPERFPADLSTWAFGHFFSFASPVVIGTQHFQAVKEDGVTAKFICNDNVNRLIFEVYLEKGISRTSSVRLSKDGVSVPDTSNYINTFRTPFIMTVIIDMDKAPSNIYSRGEWTMQVFPSEVSDLSIFATADDHKLKMNAHLIEQNVRVGDAIHPTVSLKLFQAPIENAVVKAIIERPEYDLSDLLANTNVGTLPNPNEESNGCDGQKLGYLLANNPEFAQKARSYISDTILLTHRSGGNYSGEYNGIVATGVHKIRYWVGFKTNDYGWVERVDEQTLFVQFGDIDFNLSDPSNSVAVDPPGYYYTARFTPSYKDPQGNTKKLGPGYEHLMKVKGAKNTGRVIDQCNGTYELNFSDTDPDPNIQVFVDDDLVYNGPASDFKPGSNPNAGNISPWFLSLHAGATLPSGKLDSLYSPGFSIEADLGYRLNAQADLEALFGYYGFGSKFHILGASALFGYLPSLGSGWTLHPAVGVGVFVPRNESATAGLTARVELIRDFNSRWQGVLHGAYFNLPGPNYQFLGLGLGLKYRL